MSQVLIHLLSLVRKHSPAGSPITITLHQEGEEAIVQFGDSRVAMTQELLPHILEPFYRIPGVEALLSTRPDVSLGLYLSQQIVERHGGRIEVQNSAEEGSIFSVMLPLAATSMEEQANDTESARGEPTLFQPPRWLVS